MTPRDSFDRWPQLDELFAQALETPPEERSRFLDSACRGDGDLRRELDALLAAHRDADTFLENPAAWIGELPTAPAPPTDDTADRVAPWIGRMVGPYEVLEPIGAGGMGVLVKARDSQLDRLVTLKFLQPHLGAQPVALQRFLQEAQAASALDHPNICTIYGVGESPDGQRFIAMAYYAGETLKERLARAPVPVDEALAIAEQIGDGLARAHDAGIVHRDLKPANVMLTERGDVKILDFGIAKLEGSGDITQSGARVGTAAYMSPEQARGDEVDHRTDVWSLGVVLYEMLVGERPFPGTNEQAVIYGILNEQPAASDAVPRDVDAVIRGALVKDVSQRYPDVRAFLDALRAVRAGRPPARVPGSGASRLRIAVLAGAVVLGAAGLVTLLPLGDRDGTGADPPALLVLPFTNLGAPEDDYFAEGVTEEIVQRLATLQDVRVLARTTARQIQRSGRPLVEIADSLGIAYVLEGTVRWAPGADGASRVRIAPRFVRLADGAALWSEPVEGALADVFRLQAEIAERVADGLQLQLGVGTAGNPRGGPTENLDAYNAYLVGQYHINRREIPTALAALEDAVRLDSMFAPAWAALASALGLYPFYIARDSTADLAFARAEQAARRALEIQPDLAEAYAALGWTLLSGRWDWDGAEVAFDRAIALSPQLAPPHHWRSQVHLIRGDRAAALRDITRAVELDPLNAAANTNLGYHLAMAHRYDEALTVLERAIALRSDFVWPYADVAFIRARQERWDDARTAMRRTLELAGLRAADIDTVVAGFGTPDARARERAAATLGRWADQANVLPTMAGWFFTILGDTDRAVDWLLRAHEIRDPNPLDAVTLLRLHPGDERARAALRALGVE